MCHAINYWVWGLIHKELEHKFSACKKFSVEVKV